MNLFFRNTLARPGAIIALALAGILSGGAAHAAGTAAGQAITNLATLNYSVGGTAQSPIGSSATGNTTGAGTNTSFVVDNKINLLVTTTDVSPGVSVVPGSTAATATFSVLNSGNSTQDFSLSTANLATLTTNPFGGTADNFNPTACSVKVESGATAGYQVLEDTATFIDELAADASKTVYVICSIPSGQINDDIGVISLTATALVGGTSGSQGAALVETTTANTAGVDIVFADVAGTDDAARNAQHSSRDVFKVVTATLTVTKTVAPVCDPFNGSTNPKNIPGSFVRYTITIANTGLAGAPSAALTSIADTLTALVTFDSDLIGGASAAACVAGAAPESAALSGIKIVNAARTAAGVAGYPKYRTTAADADGAGVAPIAGVPTLTVDFATVLPVEGTYTAGQLKATESVSVIYQVKIN
ncbi:hypothetical protein LP416_09455 [Polaromonas sp. P2-4]|nr:hypothetical protein LP416_09455 [Polaromonas sp. P2-4]